jgi:hypothetical protein
MLWRFVIDGLLFCGAMAYFMVLGVRRSRMERQIRAIAAPGTPLYQRNRPPKAARWDANHEGLDRWSTRKLGAWWVWRALYCVISGAGYAVALVWINGFLPHAYPPELILAITMLNYYFFVWRVTFRRTQSDLAIAQSQAATDGLRNGGALREAL